MMRPTLAASAAQALFSVSGLHRLAARLRGQGSPQPPPGPQRPDSAPPGDAARSVARPAETYALCPEPVPNPGSHSAASDSSGAHSVTGDWLIKAVSPGAARSGDQASLGLRQGLGRGAGDQEGRAPVLFPAPKPSGALHAHPAPGPAPVPAARQRDAAPSPGAAGSGSARTAAAARHGSSGRVSVPRTDGGGSDGAVDCGSGSGDGAVGGGVAVGGARPTSAPAPATPQPGGSAAAGSAAGKVKPAASTPPVRRAAPGLQTPPLRSGSQGIGRAGPGLLGLPRLHASPQPGSGSSVVGLPGLGLGSQAYPQLGSGDWAHLLAPSVSPAAPLRVHARAGDPEPNSDPMVLLSSAGQAASSPVLGPPAAGAAGLPSHPNVTGAAGIPYIPTPSSTAGSPGDLLCWEDSSDAGAGGGWVDGSADVGGSNAALGGDAAGRMPTHAAALLDLDEVGGQAGAACSEAAFVRGPTGLVKTHAVLLLDAVDEHAGGGGLDAAVSSGDAAGPLHTHDASLLDVEVADSTMQEAAAGGDAAEASQPDASLLLDTEVTASLLQAAATGPLGIDTLEDEQGDVAEHVAGAQTSWGAQPWAEAPGGAEKLGHSAEGPPVLDLWDAPGAQGSALGSGLQQHPSGGGTLDLAALQGMALVGSSPNAELDTLHPDALAAALGAHRLDEDLGFGQGGAAAGVKGHLLAHPVSLSADLSGGGTNPKAGSPGMQDALLIPKDPATAPADTPSGTRRGHDQGASGFGDPAAGIPGRPRSLEAEGAAEPADTGGAAEETLEGFTFSASTPAQMLALAATPRGLPVQDTLQETLPEHGPASARPTAARADPPTAAPAGAGGSSEAQGGVPGVGQGRAAGEEQDSPVTGGQPPTGWPPGGGPDAAHEEEPATPAAAAQPVMVLGTGAKAITISRKAPRRPHRCAALCKAATSLAACWYRCRVRPAGVLRSVWKALYRVVCNGVCGSEDPRQARPCFMCTCARRWPHGGNGGSNA